MEPTNKTAAPSWRRTLLGTGTVAIMALVLALAAVLDLVDAEVAVTGCVALAVIAAVFVAMMRTGFSARFTEGAFVAQQMSAVFLLLAWLTFRAEDTPSAISVLYLVAMLYGVLVLDRWWLAGAALFAMVSHGIAIFLLIDTGHRINMAATWTQYGALVLACGWFTYAAGIVSRLRARVSEAHRRLHDLGVEAEERARRDVSTGVFNYPHLMESLEREVARAQRLDKPLCVARVDLDGLGKINDTQGAAAGDAALRRFVAAAGGALRNVDVFGRYGGNEFLVLMPDTDIAGAIVAGERIRAAVARAAVTCTVGLAEHSKGADSRAMLTRAESALNYAKAAGRDRVVALGADGAPVAARAA